MQEILIEAAAAKVAFLAAVRRELVRSPVDTWSVKTMNAWMGIFLVVLAGLGTGTMAWPMKLMRRLSFEHYWFLGMLVSLVLAPWAVVLCCVPRPWEVYAEVGWRPILLCNLFSICWGIANVLYGVCVLRIGAALTGAVLSGLGVAAGVTLPMILKGSGIFK